MFVFFLLIHVLQNDNELVIILAAAVDMFKYQQKSYKDADAVTKLKSFSTLKMSRYKSFRALNNFLRVVWLPY